jgi:hypothetical protein
MVSKRLNTRYIRFLLVSLTLIILGIVLPQWYLFGSIPITLILLRFFDPSAVYFLFRRNFWLWLCVTVVVLPLIGGDDKIALWGIHYSLSTLLIGLRVATRGFLIFTAMTLIRRHIPPQILAFTLWKLGLKNLAPLLPLSFHLLPSLMETTTRTISIWRQRGGLKRYRWRNLQILLTSLQIRWSKEAEDLTITLALNSRQNYSPSVSTDNSQKFDISQTHSSPQFKELV